MPQPPPVHDEKDMQTTPGRPYPPSVQGEEGEPSGSLGRLVAIIVSAGLAWATAVTLVAWVLGRLLANN